MLCHCVTSANRARYAAQLQEMYRQRHDVFVDELGWRDLRRDDGRDIDDYDTDETVYFLVLNDAGDVVASTRMNPSYGRHQLEDGGSLRLRFAQAEPPKGPHVWEASRLIGGFRERYGRDFARATLGILVAGTQEFCARRGITLGLSILEVPAVMMLQAIGLETEPLGLPVTYDTDKGPSDAFAVTWKAGARYLIRVRQKFGIVGPVLFEAAPVLDEADAQPLDVALLETVAELRAESNRSALMKIVHDLLETEGQSRIGLEAAPRRAWRRRARVN